MEAREERFGETSPQFGAALAKAQALMTLVEADPVFLDSLSRGKRFPDAKNPPTPSGLLHLVASLRSESVRKKLLQQHRDGPLRLRTLRSSSSDYRSVVNRLYARPPLAQAVFQKGDVRINASSRTNQEASAVADTVANYMRHSGSTAKVELCFDGEPPIKVSAAGRFSVQDE
jgi:hypothetical protein